MVRRTMRLRTGSGGAVLRIMVRLGTSCFTMVVAYIPTTAPAAMGAIFAVSRLHKLTMISTSAVSRLHKLIPVYSFYSYWRIKGK